LDGFMTILAFLVVAMLTLFLAFRPTSKTKTRL